MDSDYIENYFLKHLTVEEFDILRPKIISFQRDKFQDLTKFIYYPCIRVYNQTMYNPKLYDTERDVIETINYVKYKCEKCSNVFVNRDLYIQKNKIKIYCQDCTLCNRSFKIRSVQNIYGEKMTYQSKLELKFIHWCAKHNIRILNGPKINYDWENKQLRYIVDFYIPDLNWLVELKDNHVWHKQQVANGKWASKMKQIETLLYNKTYDNYLLIFPTKYQEYKKLILDKI